MNPLLNRRHLGLASLLAVGSPLASAQAPEALPSGDANQAIEQTLLAARDAQRGVMLYVQGQTVAGLVLQVQPGQWVALRNQQYGRIVVRLERIDAVARS